MNKYGHAGEFIAMSDGPVIGITTSTESEAELCAESVRRNGGVPWLILPDHALSIRDTLRRIDGLLISGVGDLDPSWHSKIAVSDSDDHGTNARDANELQLLRAALDDDTPILGVSRGMQALNVTLGGTLIEKLDGHASSWRDGEEISNFHRIYIAPGSKLAAVVGSGGFVRVNSRHHQGVMEMHKSPLLLASAYSLDDGVIEALESPEHGWAIGVQFHPERRHEVPPHFDKLFQGLVEWSEGVRA